MGVAMLAACRSKDPSTPTTLASKRMLNAAGVKCVKLSTNVKTLTLDFVPAEEK